MQNLMEFYKSKDNIQNFVSIINGEQQISLRIIDWFVTNYAKKYYTVYEITQINGHTTRFKVYNDYKLKLKAYSKRRFDPFCRWERITFPYDDNRCIETTIGQLNFFKWAIEYKIIQYIQDNYEDIENDMNQRNTKSKLRNTTETSTDSTLSLSSSSMDESNSNTKTRKKREELSVSACKCIKKETVKILIKFSP
jgi:hypothetical protein